jgi:hypothetical protein
MHKLKCSIYIKLLAKANIMHNSNIVDILDRAIYFHAQWKIRLKSMIYQHQNSISIQTIKDNHVCDFGQWLDSQNSKTLPNYDEIYAKHQIFHQQAAEVARLLKIGDITAAEEQMRFGGEFSQASADLVNLLSACKDQLTYS